MDKTLRRFRSLDEMRAASIRDWQRLPPSERLKAASEISFELYALKGQLKDVPRLQRTLVRVKRPRVRYLIVGGYAVGFHGQPGRDERNAEPILAVSAISKAPHAQAHLRRGQ